MSISLFLPFLCLLIVSTHSFYEGIDYITNLNQKTFADDVLRSPSVWIIEFYAPWCQHCQNFQTDYQLAAENLKEIVHFGAINCDIEENKPLCGYFKVETLPTVFAFKPQLEQVEVEGNTGLTKNPIKYQGPLKPASLAKWAASFLSEPFDPVLDINSENIEKFLSNEKWKNKAFLFTDKDKKSNLIRALALKYKIDILTKTWLPIGQVAHTQQSIVERFGVTSFPTFLVVDEEGEIKSRFSGQFTISELSDFLKPYAYIPTEEDLSPKEQKKPTKPKEPPKKKEVKLHHVTDQESFDSACFQLGLCLIAFLDPQAEEHKDYIIALEGLAKKHTSVQVMWLDGNKHEPFKLAFGVAESHPQAVAYQRKGLRYRIFMGGFETDLLSEFIELVQGGGSKKGRIMVLDKEPEVGGEEKEEL